MRRKYLVSNGIMSAVSKSNKCKTYQQKINNLLTIEKHVLVSNYFCINVFHLLDFDMDNVVHHLIQNIFSLTRPLLYQFSFNNLSTG